jgi:hypothetical protein
VTHVSGDDIDGTGCGFYTLPWNREGIASVCVLPATVEWRAFVVREVVVTVIIAAHPRHGAARLKHKHKHTHTHIKMCLGNSEDF